LGGGFILPRDGLLPGVQVEEAAHRSEPVQGDHQSEGEAPHGKERNAKEYALHALITFKYRAGSGDLATPKALRSPIAKGGSAAHAHKAGASELRPAIRSHMPKPVIPAEIA
jgi:hypothetical protein